MENSAFWGQSFVAELTRISAQGERKLKLRRASLVKQPSQPTIPESSEPDSGEKTTDEETSDKGDSTAEPRREQTHAQTL